MKRAQGGAEQRGEDLEILSCAAHMRSGALLDDSIAGAARDRLEGLAATLPELFGTADPSWLERISERLSGEQGAGNFSEILLVSEQQLHVIQPLQKRPGVALLAISAATNNIGLVLSALHARVASLEDE